jgi:quinol monooxygenase YgiN
VTGIVVVGDLDVLVGRREELLELLAQTQAEARREAGCESYAFAEVVDEPGHVVICQEWADAPALEEHYRSAAFARYQQRVGEFLARPSEVRIHHVGETVRPQGAATMDPRRAD